MQDVLRSRPASYWVTVTAVVTVAFVAAVISYSHITDIALAAGEDWRSYLIPWTFDGVVLAASMTMMIRRARGLAYGWLPISALGFGVVGSIAANIANAVTRSQTILGNHGIAVMLAGFVPLAFLACFHMLLGQHALVSIKPDVELSPPSPEVGQQIGQAGLSQIGSGNPDIVGGAEGREVADLPSPQVPTWPASSIRGGWPVTGRPVPVPEFGSLPQWKLWRLDVDGSSTAAQRVPEGTGPSGVSPHGHGSRNGTALLDVGLPPLAEIQSAAGQSVGHESSSPSSSTSTLPGTSDGKSIESTTSSPSTRQDTTAGTPATSDSGSTSSSSDASAMPGDVSPYLVDELYNLAAEDRMTLADLLRMGRFNGSRPPSTEGQPAAAGSRPSPAGQSAGPGPEASPEVNSAAHPTPTTPPPVLPSQRQPEPVPESDHQPSGNQPLSTDQILAYLDDHPGITVRQAAIDLKVSESTVYRAKRARTQAGGRP